MIYHPTLVSKPKNKKKKEKEPRHKQYLRVEYFLFIFHFFKITGTELTYVDATEKIQTVKAFVETSIRRPPVIRFPNPNPSF